MQHFNEARESDTKVPLELFPDGRLIYYTIIDISYVTYNFTLR